MRGVEVFASAEVGSAASMNSIVLGRFLLLVATCVAVSACKQRITTPSSPLHHDIYVWQRAWTDDVRDGLEQSRTSIDRHVVFAGQINVANQGSKPVRPAIDYAALKQLQRPVGLAIRVEPFFGAFDEHGKEINAIAQLCKEVVAEAQTHDIQVAELQLDFDCPDSKLEGYRRWLRTARTALRPLPVIPTALPSWLKQSAFASLARDSDKYVLQLHSVAPPRDVANTVRLTEPARARAWVKAASKIGVPFRVALPTYAYLVAYDKADKALGVSAEGPASQWPQDARVVRWEADPAELAGLILEWNLNRPPHLSGIIWYRLPVADDSLNWRWITLERVMRGVAPRRELHLESSEGPPNDVRLINHGETDEALPECIEASWNEPARLVAADALNGYVLQKNPSVPNSIRFARIPQANLVRMPPGSQRTVGWIRCDTPVKPSLEIVAPE